MYKKSITMENFKAPITGEMSFKVNKKLTKR